MKKIKEQKNKLTLKTPINLQRKIDEIFKLIMKEKDEEKFKKYVLEIKNNTKKLFENLYKKQKLNIKVYDNFQSPIFAIEFSVFINSAYYRLYDLLKGVIELSFTNNYLSSLILQRQLYETIAYIRWFLDSAENSISDKNIDEFIKFTINVYTEIYVDKKITKDHPFVFLKLENIQTAIRYYKKQPKLILNDVIDNDMMDKYYSKLSNILHPNAEGLSRFYINENLLDSNGKMNGYAFSNFPSDIGYYGIFFNILYITMEIEVYLNRISKKIELSKNSFYEFLYTKSNGNVRELLKDQRTKFIKNKGVYYQKEFFEEMKKN